MQVTEKGQVTIPKPIRDAAGVHPGSQVTFTLEGGRIVITKLSTGKVEDRRKRLALAAAKVRNSMDPAFRQMSAHQINAFLRGEVDGPG